MNTTVILLIIFITVLVLAIIITRRNRGKGESKLSINEHPSTFKKPNIEMVNTASERKELPNKIYEINPDDNKTMEE
jgi:hypothetical protein